MSRDALVRSSAQSASVLREVLERYAKWFVHEEGDITCSVVGFAALGRELVARTPRVETEDPTIATAWRAIAAHRPAPKNALDQVYATEASVAARARLLIETGALQRGLLFVGDDDLTSAAVMLASEVSRPVTVLDTDPDILGVLEAARTTNAWDLRTLRHDLRQPVPPKMQSKYGAVFTDPPYASEGFALFISRAIDLLKPDGRLYVCFGYSGRATERGLQKQALLTDAGLLVERVLPDFTSYVGAESIGSASDLWICRPTPKTKPLVAGPVEGDLYTSRSPASQP